MQFSWLLVGLATTVLAQYPKAGSNFTTIVSPVDGNIRINYKQPNSSACRTAFETQRQYTGWVNIPGPYETNTFFWFIEGRQPTTQLTIWLNGGPGSSSMLGLFAENGPCEVVELGENSFGTKVREWGWDRASNVLYIDQPNQVGFSYDVPTKGSFDMLNFTILQPEQSPPAAQLGATFLNGTFSSQNPDNTANTTETAAMSIWHMLQGFLGAFPQYAPKNDTTMGVHLFAESYGGKYGPAFAALWDQQNQALAAGTISNKTHMEIKLKSLGIVNGCVDDLIQAPYWPIMAVNNTYGLKAISQTRANLANASFYAPGGCQDLVRQCRAAVRMLDPGGQGNVASVNTLCSSAYSNCTNNVLLPYTESGRSIYDIAAKLPDSFPPSTYFSYLNTPALQEAIGTPINYTGSINLVFAAFAQTGDLERVALVPSIAALLKSGIRVGLIYGDRDMVCNWMGAEALSFAIADAVSPAHQQSFAAAGYAPIITNTSYIGGAVRQYGNLSFSRIYDAGHSVPAYQPETAFQVFARIIGGTSISTGQKVDLSTYNTTGPANATHTNDLPDSPKSTCWVRNVGETCTDEQKEMIRQGEGVIINDVLYSARSDWDDPSTATSSATGKGSKTASGNATEPSMTGAFTATSTPKGDASAKELSMVYILLLSLTSASFILA